MYLFLKILCYVSVVSSACYLIFYRTGIADSLVISCVLTFTSFLSGAFIFYGKGWDDGYKYRK